MIPTVRLALGLAEAGVRLIYFSSGGTVYSAQTTSLPAEDMPFMARRSSKSSSTCRSSSVHADYAA